MIENSKVEAENFVSEVISKVAPLPVDILLEGETGVGKDTVAKQVHHLSGRKGAFVALNCAALPEGVAEAELFGAEAGAFTGAVKARPGRVEAANRGTLYLDEIDSMPLWLQAKLLRVIQERGCERLGSTKFIPSDFRVVASTQSCLGDLVEAGKLRQDLYFRLNVVHVKLPPLRQCPQRLMQLFRDACAEFGDHAGREVPEIAHVEARILAHTWPGNIRELRAAACRHVLGLSVLDAVSSGVQSDFAQSETAASEAVIETTPVEQIALSPPQHGSLKERIRGFEKELILNALSKCSGSVSKASEELKVPLHTLYYRMKSLGVQTGGSC